MSASFTSGSARKSVIPTRPVNIATSPPPNIPPNLASEESVLLPPRTNAMDILDIIQSPK